MALSKTGQRVGVGRLGAGWWVAVIVAGGLAIVLVTVLQMLRRDREALLARFADDKHRELAEAAREVEEDLEDIGEDLRFAVRLVDSADTPDERARELGALIAVVRHYRTLSVHDARGELVLRVLDPLAAPSFDASRFNAPAVRAAREALGRTDEIAISPRLTAAGAGWYRVFARASQDLGRAQGAVAVVVDTEPIFRRMRPVASAQSTKLLLLGTQGLPTAASDPKLARLLEPGGTRTGDLPNLRRLTAAMKSGEEGTLLLPEREAERAGLGVADGVAVFRPIRMAGGAHWSVATITSTRVLRSHERAIVLRLLFGAGLVALLLVGAGVFIVVSARRAVALRERLVHAEELAHLHEKTEKILENIPTGVLCLADDGRVTALNRVLRERMPAAGIGTRLGEALAPAGESARAVIEELVQTARSANRIRSLFGARLQLFGGAGQYNLHAVPLDPRVPEASLLLVVEDLSELGSLESQLLRAEKLATVGVLAAGIAHEIGTPLSVVRGRAELILGKLGREHPQAGALGVIIAQIDRITRTIRQLLDFSRSHPGLLRSVPVRAAAESVCELLRWEAERRRVALALEIPDAALAVSADPDQLQQLLVNLVLNACDACKAGGTVRVGAARVGADEVRLEVADDGCGIDPAHREQIFDPFFTTKKRGQGTGLGLAIAARIARDHRARIELESALGSGTRVSVFWPTAAAPSEVRDAVSG